jgi:molybdopterin converting factor subunit 1
MIHANILFFASLKDKVGVSKVSMQLPDDISVADLKKHLIQLYPKLEPMIGKSITAINREFALDDQFIPEDAEVAIFPPVSGGAEFPTMVKVIDEPIDLNGMVAQLTSERTGAACIFTGVVRGFTRRNTFTQTSALVYEAYIPMAEAKMVQITEEIRMQWSDIEGISIVQRIGRLEAGTPTVAIVCTASHRDTGVFEAARYGIDRLKEIVPVWKKEIGTKGEEWIEGDYLPRQGD